MKNLSLVIALSFISFLSFSQNSQIEICQNSHNTFIYENENISLPLFEIRKSNFDGDIGHIELRRQNSYAVYLIVKQVNKDGKILYWFVDQQIETLKSIRIDIVNADMINHIDKILG
tara:strand:- start:1116 stop:1466 length:351 start_codon:yes stop_codon:yes gene_type:complete